MKYIRTNNDKIYDLKAYSGWEVDEDGNYHIWHHPKYSCVYYIDIEAEDVIKQADTIEELCDEIVIHNPNNDGEFFPKYFVYQNRREDLLNKKHADFCKKYYKLKVEIYGAIWTDKGLIYVAKMNDKGELELL